MGDLFITRNGVRKVIDDSDPTLVEAARAKGWTFESEATPVDSAQAPVDLESAPVNMAPTFVRMQRGAETKDVSSDLLGVAREKGWAEVPTEAVARTEATDAERTQATAQGFLKGASLGSGALQDYVGAAGDQVASWFDGVPRSFGESLDMIRANREAVAARAPINALGGEVAGTVASALAPGGAANVAARLGANVTARVAPRVAARVGTGLLGRALTAGTGLAAEGAAYDLASTVAGGDEEFNRAVSEGDWGGAAQRLVVKPLEGAALNVLGGAVVHGAASGVKLGLRSLRKGAQEVVEAVDDDLVKAIETQTADAAQASELRAVEAKEVEATRARLDMAEESHTLETKALTELEQNMQRAAAPQLPTFEADDPARFAAAYEGRKAFRGHADSSAPRLKEALDVLKENAEYADANLALASKKRFIAALQDPVAKANVAAEVESQLARFYENLSTEAATALDDLTGKKLTGLAAKAEKAMTLFRGKLGEGEAGQAFNILEELKRETGRLAKRGTGTVKGVARSEYEQRLKPLLEREDLFQSAARLQKPFNAVWAPEISAEMADGLSGAFIDTGKKSAHDAFESAERASEDWVRGTLQGDSPVRLEALRQWIATKAASQSVRADLLGSAEGLERAAKARQAMSDALAILDENARLRAGDREWQALAEDLKAEQLLNQGPVAAARNAVAGTVGAAVGAVPVIGKPVADYLVGKMTKTNLASAIERAGIQAEKNEAVRKAAAAKAAAAVKAAQKKRNAAAIKAARREKWTQGAERIIDISGPAIRAATREELDRLQEQSDAAVTSPLSALEPMLGPDLTAAYAQQRQARDAYLLQMAGPAPNPGPFGQAKREWSEYELDRIGRAKEAADDPTAAIERIAAGNATSEDMPTVQALYPALLQDLRQTVFAELASKKRTLAYEDQLALSDALGLPPDPTTTAFWSTIGQVPVTNRSSEARSDLVAEKAASAGSQLG